MGDWLYAASARVVGVGAVLLGIAGTAILSGLWLRAFLWAAGL